MPTLLAVANAGGERLARRRPELRDLRGPRVSMQHCRMADPDPELPEANPDGDGDEDDDRVPIGEPFALSGDCGLLDGGSYAAVACEACGTHFRMNLLTSGYKVCPGCGLRYTSVLLVSLEDDDEIMSQALDICFAAAEPDVVDATGESAEPEPRHASGDGEK